MSSSSSSLSFFLSSFFFRLSDKTKRKRKKTTNLDRVVDRLGQVVAKTRHGARKVERRRRRVHRRPRDPDRLERRVCRVFQSRRGNVAVNERVSRRVHDGLGTLKRPVPRGLEDDALVDVPPGGRVDEVGREGLWEGDDDVGRRGGGRGGELRKNE